MSKIIAPIALALFVALFAAGAKADSGGCFATARNSIDKAISEKKTYLSNVCSLNCHSYSSLYCTHLPAGVPDSLGDQTRMLLGITQATENSLTANAVLATAGTAESRNVRSGSAARLSAMAKNLDDVNSSWKMAPSDFMSRELAVQNSKSCAEAGPMAADLGNLVRVSGEIVSGLEQAQECLKAEAGELLGKK